MKTLRFLWILLLLSLPGFSQSQAFYPAPIPHFQFFNSSGVPLAGGQIFTYLAGTTTPSATFTDATGATQNSNPIVLDSSGSANIWLGLHSYKFVVEDAQGNQQWTQDNIGNATQFVALNPTGNALQTITGPIQLGSGGTQYDFTANHGTFNALLTGNNGITINTAGAGNNDTFLFTGNTSGNLFNISNAGGDTNTSYALNVATLGSTSPMNVQGPGNCFFSMLAGTSATGGLIADANVGGATPCPFGEIFNNPSSGGPVTNKLAKIQANSSSPTTNGLQAILPSTSDVNGFVGICDDVALGSNIHCNSNLNSSNSIATRGRALCQFDATAITAADYVVASGTTAGDCHDYGSVPPPAGTQCIGRAELSGSASTVQPVYLGGCSIFQLQGTAVLGTGAINSNTCAATVTVAATGVTTSTAIAWSMASDPNTVTGYGAGATGTLSIWAFPTSNNVNFRVCNLTGGSITPGAMTLNWSVSSR